MTVKQLQTFLDCYDILINNGHSKPAMKYVFAGLSLGFGIKAVKMFMDDYEINKIERKNENE